MSLTPQTITIDGPAASGKTTIGQQLAERLNYLFLDTGCMYRAATLAALKAGIDVHDEARVTALMQSLKIDIQPVRPETDDGRAYTVLLEGEDVTWAIRKPDVDANVSQVSTYGAVRDEMVARQRQIGKTGRVVMVGRDIGTVVMPDASLKLYVTASATERARRRWHDRQAQGSESEFDVILADVVRRDTIDSNRVHSPLRPAADAIIIDSTDREPEQLLAEILNLVHGQTIES